MAFVDVLLVCYNQERYIEQTLRSVLSQKTTFDYRIVVADDHSLDDTMDIIRKVEKESGREFTYLDNSKNLGISANYYRSVNACDAKYVAIMEGDDFWIDEYRLQKHIDFLEARQDYSMSFNKIQVVTSDNKSHIQPMFEDEYFDKGFYRVDGKMLAMSNVIGNFSACVYRTELLKKLDEEIFMNGYDWIINLKMAQMGKICCMLQPQSVYRLHAGGVWSRKSRTEQIEDVLDAIERYDKLTDYEFTDSFKKHSSILKAELSSIENGGIQANSDQKPQGAVALIKCEMRMFLLRLIAFVRR